MISLAPIVTLLKPKPVDFDGLWFRKVEGAADYARLDPNSIPSPAAWVIRAADKSRHAGERAEDVALGFHVVISVNYERTKMAGDVDDVLLQYRLAVKDILLGHEYAGIRPIQFNGGNVLNLGSQELLWADSYAFNALITNYLPTPPNFESVNYTGE